MANEIPQPTQLQLIEQAVLTVGVDTPIETIAGVLNGIDFIYEEAKRIRKLLEERLTERLQETGGDLVVGSIRYYLGVHKTTKVRSAPRAIETILTVTSGDMEAFASLLSSDWLKPGATRALLENNMQSELYGEIFEITEKPELREGKPVKKLIKTDERFIR